jgi:Dyp-type peroxidase family
MQIIDVQSKSKSLLGVSDLTLVATIKSGLIPALDSRTYETRVRLLLRTLNALRVSSLEAEPTPLIGDAVDRIRALHSFRLAIIGEDQPRRLLLSVAFDGGWEPYMRRIWRDLGPLLDVIFCNCEGYLDSYGHDYPAYAGWVRSAQVDTQFFYNAISLTVSDLNYLRRKVATDLNGVGEERPHGVGLDREEAKPNLILKQALPALTALYRLTDLYPPIETDGDFLLRAAKHLLGYRAEQLRRTDPEAGRNPTERAALKWFARSRARDPSGPAAAEFSRDNVQGGIIDQYKDATHACLLLVALRDSAAARDMLAYLEPEIKRTAATQGEADKVPWVNLGFTFQGLALAGVPNGTLELLPFEFREGMVARASILGDRLYNHPARWSLPERNWPRPGEPADRVELTTVHAIVQFTCATPSDRWHDLANDEHPLADAIGQFDRALSGKGVQILSVQGMQRYLKEGEDRPRGHFDFVDGISQPTLGAPAKRRAYSDEIVPGDLLLGYGNSLSDPPLTGKLWDDSTFLVVRKLKQDVKALNAVLEQNKDPKGTKAKFMGRTSDGEILIDDRTITDRKGNDFNYSTDPDGMACPFQSHMRRANPRIPAEQPRDDIRTVPRIVRRGMSYGPPFNGTNADADRGLFFMAYNASIAEQFEVIQAWLSGSNSSDQNTYSAMRDPFLGVPQHDDPNSFVFYDKGGARVVAKLDSETPVVKLEWGLYAFVPSIKAIAELKSIADLAAKIEEGADDHHRKTKEDQRTLRLAVEARKGEEFIAKLRLAEQFKGFDAAAEQWKIVLEDFSLRMAGLSRAVWTAVRELHGGVLRTPYGVLICSKELVNRVFNNRERHYTVTGYAERMKGSFGEIFLGKDDDGLPTSGYCRESRPANDTLMGVTIRDGFESAFKHSRDALNYLIPDGAETRLEVKDFVDDVLARISSEWFSVPDDKFVERGGWDWRSAGPPTCPGHFHSPSRYMFQPNPGPPASLAGQQHGQLLKAEIGKFFEAGGKPQGKIGKAIFEGYQGDQRTSTLIGVMMGFLPTVDGNIRGALLEWVNNRSLWDYQLAYLADATEDRLERAMRVLMPKLEETLLLRPVPELVWRTALVPHFIGPVEVRPGDRIVVSIVSATQECLSKGDDDGLYLIFGGKRSEKDHPTHACPAYKMAIGVMLGMLAGLLEFTKLRPTMSPVQLTASLRNGG